MTPACFGPGSCFYNQCQPHCERLITTFERLLRGTPQRDNSILLCVSIYLKVVLDTKTGPERSAHQLGFVADNVRST